MNGWPLIGLKVQLMDRDVILTLSKLKRVVHHLATSTIAPDHQRDHLQALWLNSHYIEKPYRPRRKTKL